MPIDQYQTILKPSTGFYKEKGSKFLAYAFPINSEEEFKTHLNHLKKEYHDARHHCYAFKLGLDDNNYRYSDDGEPNNSAGSPIYGQILSFGITNVAIIVVRYFGGTKLGVGGLVSAYKEATKDALDNAKIITTIIKNHYSLTFNYEVMGTVMKMIKIHQLDVIQQDLTENVTIEISITEEKTKPIIDSLQSIKLLKVIYLGKK